MQDTRLNKLLEMETQDPLDPFIHYALAMEYKGLGKNEPAMERLMKCKELNPQHVPAHYQLGLLFMEAGRTEEALQLLKAGLGLLQGSSDTRTINEFRSLMEELEF